MPSDGNFAYLNAITARAAMASGEFSAETYVSALLERATWANVHLNAFLSLSFDQALASARRADRRRAAGLPLPPLHGLPFAVKDMIDVEGEVTTAHSRFPAEPATETAPAVRRLEQRGAIYMGKLALEEFGIGSPLDNLPWPSPKNPWDRSRTTGGSSSGSAVALAAGLVPLALGTDTGGSVRAPAAFCGLVALKPTDHRISMRGVIPLALTLDTIGSMARTAADCALLFSALTENHFIEATEPNRIGAINVAAAGQTIDRDLADAQDEALAVLRSLGDEVASADFRAFASARKLGGTVLAHEAHAFHRERLVREPHLYGATCRRRLEKGADIGPGAYADAMARRLSIRADIDRLFETFDVLALPATFGAAASLNDSGELDRSSDVTFRLIFNLTGHPAIVFCTGFTETGLPLSMQLVGRRGEDERLLDMVTAYQRVTDWHEHHPTDQLWERQR